MEKEKYLDKISEIIKLKRVAENLKKSKNKEEIYKKIQEINNNINGKYSKNQDVYIVKREELKRKLNKYDIEYNKRKNNALKLIKNIKEELNSEKEEYDKEIKRIKERHERQKKQIIELGNKIETEKANKEPDKEKITKYKKAMHILKKEQEGFNDRIISVIEKKKEVEEFEKNLTYNDIEKYSDLIKENEKQKAKRKEEEAKIKEEEKNAGEKNKKNESPKKPEEKIIQSKPITNNAQVVEKGNNIDDEYKDMYKNVKPENLPVDSKNKKLNLWRRIVKRFKKIFRKFRIERKNIENPEEIIDVFSSAENEENDITTKIAKNVQKIKSSKDEKEEWINNMPKQEKANNNSQEVSDNKVQATNNEIVKSETRDFEKE